MNLAHLKQLKSSKLLDLQVAKAAGKTQEVQKLGFEAAQLEGAISSEYIRQGDTCKAIVNLISQASCLCIAGRSSEALSVFSHAHDLTNSAPLKKWIASEMSSIQKSISRNTQYTPPPIPKKFLTNQGENTLSKRLEKILPLTHDFDCLVGYFFISGFFRLYPSLESVNKIRILIGLKNEQVIHGLIQIANDSPSENLPSTAETKATFGGMMRTELVQAEDSLKIELGIRKFIEWIRSGKLEVKLYREQNIHAKVYIMTPEHIIPDVNHGYVITGSSNFSHNGLEGNLEFNVLLAEPEEHDYALHRFNELWQQAVDVKDIHETIINAVEKESPFAFFTPYELYLKFLTEYFRDYLGDRTKLSADNLPRNFKKLQYQEDAVFTAQQMLKTYNGVFIADVVGLGKTYMAALLALQLDGRCLVIAPPSLLDENSPGSWPRVFRDFCIPGHKCVSLGKLEEVLAQGVEFYKYVIVDESHRFKGDSTQRYELLTRICQNKGVILVSATPYNNTLTDIYSQLKLFQPPRNSTIPGLRNLEEFFDELQSNIKGLHRIDDSDAYFAAIEKNAHKLREQILKYVMVRRTRREIEEFYGADLKKQGISFPKCAKPEPLLYRLNRIESSVFSTTLEKITSKDFHYARYQPLNPQYYTGPIEERAIQGQRNLATFMKILLVKRLESSFQAFRQTLDRFINSHRLVLQAFDNGCVYTSHKHSHKVLELLEEGDDDAIDRLIQEEKAEKFPANKFTADFRKDVENDLKILESIQRSWKDVKRDPKWIEFKQVLVHDSKFTKNKIVIFSEFADTAKYLAERIEKEVDAKTLHFSSASSTEQRKQVIANFDANSSEGKDDYRILVTTDVLAEGVNLHRSAIVINYDIPWNPSRMMQRVGRVNRVGTKFKNIYTYNFFPTDEGNDEIALTEAAKAKIRAFITLLGNDARLLTGDEEITSHNLFDRINSKEATEGDEAESKSELRYLRVILDIKEKEPELFQRILSLPRKARSTRSHAPEPAPADQHEANMPTTRPALITYFRQGRLDKFFRSHVNLGDAEELDFFTTAEVLETKSQEKRKEIQPEIFYPLLDKNKAGFAAITTPGLETLLDPKASGSGNEAIILKRLRVKDFRASAGILSPEDCKFVSSVSRIIADGRVGKQTVRKVKESLDKTDDPLQIVAILRKEIASQYLVGTGPKPAKDTVAAPREVILSSYLP
jgi:superfamily II DNA or RNA helicase